MTCFTVTILSFKINNLFFSQWAFGVTCWEVFSLGRSPYPSFDNAEVLEHIESGHRLKKPSLCTKEM